MAANKPVSNYEAEEVFEEGDAPKEAQTVHRIRANSTIMKVNKILGEYAFTKIWVHASRCRASATHQT